MMDFIMGALGSIAIIALTLVAWVLLTILLDLFLPDSACNGDCGQGDFCKCKKGVPK